MRSNPYNPKNWLRFLTKRVVPGVLLFVILAMTPFEVRSGLVYTFSQVDAGVQLTCSGNLNPGGMEFGGYFTDDGSYINANPYTTCYVQYAEGFFSTYDTQQASVSWQFNLKPGFYSVYYSSWGDFFGLRIFAQSVVAVVPYQYTPGTPINGGMLFQGQTLASMGISLNDKFEVDLPGGDTIRGLVVPEPACDSLYGLLFCISAARLIRFQYCKTRFIRYWLRQTGA